MCINFPVSFNGISIQGKGLYLFTDFLQNKLLLFNVGQSKKQRENQYIFLNYFAVHSFFLGNAQFYLIKRPKQLSFL